MITYVMTETVVVDVPIFKESVISLIIQSAEEFFRLGVFAYRHGYYVLTFNFKST